MAEIIVFVDIDFCGLHTHLFTSVPNLNDVSTIGVGTLSNVNSNSWTNKISSFVIKSGKWAFFEEPNGKNKMGETFGPGVYRWVEDLGIKNDKIQSIICVSE